MEQPQDSVTIPPEASTALAKLEPKATGIVERAAELAVASETDYQTASDYRQVIKSMQDEIGKDLDPLVESAYRTHRGLTGLRSKALKPLADADAALLSRMKAYRLEQNRLAAEAERKRLDELRKAEEEERLKRAVAAVDADLPDLADVILETPVAMPVAVSPAPPPVKTAGTTEVKKWSYEMVNPLLVKRDFLSVDESKIRQTVKTLGPAAAEIVGGIRVIEDLDIRRSASR